MKDANTKGNAAFYWEVCFLRRLLQMGIIEQVAFDGICQIAAQDYDVSQAMQKSLCLKS